MHNRNRLLQVTCWLVIVVSLFTIVGWIADIPIFKSGIHYLPSMKINTAICLLLCGVVGLLFDYDTQKHFNIFLPLNLIVFFISVLTLMEYVFSLNLNIDEFLVKEHEAMFTPGRMAISSASCIVLLSMGFVIVILQPPQPFKAVAQVLFYLISFVASLAILGYIFNISRLHNLLLQKSMPLTTSVLLLLLALVYQSLLSRVYTHTKPNATR